ncbi:MAG: heavy-metal-associated domain-containing protein [Actinomycetota bacterium]
MTKTNFSVPEVHCGRCKSALEGALDPPRGVERAEVDIAVKTVTVSYNVDEIGVPVLIEIIEGQGYDVDGFQEAS